MNPNAKYTPAEINAASHLVHYHNERGGYSGGSFAEKLIELLDHADSENRKRILLVYPEYKLGVKILSESGATALSEFVRSARRFG